jgi:hypothetical protein
LIHSPLVGPSTWALVARELRRRGHAVSVPALDDTDDASERPYWQQAAESVAPQLEREGATRPLILVAHSGAGALLPAIAERLRRPVARYIFVDAVLPLDGRSRLDEFATSSPEFVEQLRAHLDAGGRFPEWTDEFLRAFIPDESLRHQTLAELHPRGKRFFTEPVPSNSDWQNAPGGYLLFSATYAGAARQAAALGWPVSEIPGGHFHMLVDPAAVAVALILGVIVSAWQVVRAKRAEAQSLMEKANALTEKANAEGALHFIQDEGALAPEELLRQLARENAGES